MKADFSELAKAKVDEKNAKVIQLHRLGSELFHNDGSKEQYPFPPEKITLFFVPLRSK